MASVLVFLPESMKARGNNLSGVIGVSMEDAKTFSKCPSGKDAENNIILWANAQCSDNWLAALGQPLELPSHDDGTLSLSDAQDLLINSITITPEMMADEDIAAPKIDRLIICPNLDPGYVAKWLNVRTD